MYVFFFFLSPGRLLSECRVQGGRDRLLDGMLVCVWRLGNWTEEGIQPEGPARLIIESPNVSVFPGCFQGLLWVWEAKVMSERRGGGWNWEGFSCQEGKDTGPRRLKTTSLATVTNVSKSLAWILAEIRSAIQTQTGFHVPRVTLFGRWKWISWSEVISIFEASNEEKHCAYFLFFPLSPLNISEKGKAPPLFLLTGFVFFFLIFQPFMMQLSQVSKLVGATLFIHSPSGCFVLVLESRNV